jgi:nucleotide sugar dehydrogenase
MKNKKKIGIVGYGYVGQAMSRFFQKHYDLRIHDPAYFEAKRLPPDPNKGSTRGNESTQEEINECDVAVVCVPTPSKEDGRCDTSIVEAVVEWLNTPLIIIKSTVEPGTTERLRQKTGKNIVFSPEYCGESSYWTPYSFHTDVKETPFFIFGGEPQDTSKCVDLYLPITGPTKVYRQTSSLEAELAKYIENSFYAMKVTFCYDMANLVEKVGGNWNECRELWLLDPRLNPMHTAVFAENDTAYSGKCFPKDINALANYALAHGYVAKMLWATIKSNEFIGEYRRLNRNGNS